MLRHHQKPKRSQGPAGDTGFLYESRFFIMAHLLRSDQTEFYRGFLKKKIFKTTIHLAA